MIYFYMFMNMNITMFPEQEERQRMFKVERAIIMAAGRGSRMRELTEDTPKPMLKVNGTRMIDTTLRALIRSGVKEILIVVGYKKERFREVAADFPQVKLVENPYYAECNNISSIYMVRDKLANAMIIEGDQYFFGDAPLAAEFEHSEYNVVWSDGPTDEWVYLVDENGRVLRCLDKGADKGWMVYGVSRWTPEDAETLRALLEYEFEERKNRQIYWDCVPMVLHPDRFPVYIRRTDPRDRVELDSVEELARLDKSYERYVEKRTC